MDRKQWLAERRTGIGSSDAAAILMPRGTPGVYRGPLEVYLDKLGMLPDEDTPQMEWGRRLEAVVAEAFTDATGIQAVPNGSRIYRSESAPWMIATPDYTTPYEVSFLECKTADSRYAAQWGPSGSDIVPTGYILQTHHQMAVLGVRHCYLAVLLGGSDFRWYHLQRNEELVAVLTARLQQFWGRVQREDPPAPDWSDPETPRLLSILHRPDPDATAVPLDAHAEQVVNNWQALGEQISELTKERERERAVLEQLMGTSPVGVLPDGRRVERKVITIKAHQRAESQQTRIYVKE